MAATAPSTLRPNAAWVLAGRAALLLQPGRPSTKRKSELQKALDEGEPRCAAKAGRKE